MCSTDTRQIAILVLTVTIDYSSQKPMKTIVGGMFSNWTVCSGKTLIVAAIASLISISCTENPSEYSQQSLKTTASSPIKVYRRTRERQGSVYETPGIIGTNPESLKIGLMPALNQTDQEQAIKSLEDYLEKELKRGVDFQIAKDNKQLVQWLVEKQIDMAYIGSVTYLEAVEKGAKIKPLVAPININTGQPWYRIGIIVNKSSPIQTLADLKGKSVAFVDQTSNFGYLAALADLKQQRINNPYQDFTQLIYVGDDSQSLTALENQLVDAVATNLANYTKQQKNAKITQKNIKIIWESAPVPNFPIVVSEELPPELIKQLQQAFLSIPTGINAIGGSESDGYTLVIPYDYDQIQQIRQQLTLVSLP